MRSLVLSFAVLSLFVALTHAESETRSLTERIAFACSQRPSLSFCRAKDAPLESFDAPPESPTGLAAAAAASSRARVAIADEVPVLESEWKRLKAKPFPKHRKWIFIPLEKALSDKRRDIPDSSDDVSASKASPSNANEPQLVIPPEPFERKQGVARTRALQSRTFPVLPSDAAYGAGQVSGTDATFRAFDGLTDARGLAHVPRSRSPFTKPGLWEPNPDDPHSRDPANKYWYAPESVGVDWLNGQLQWGGHWAVPAAGVGGTNGQSALHFPSIGTFLGIPDDYD